MSSPTAIVFGGTGGVGEGIVRVLLQEGMTVVVPSRSPYKLDRLKEYVADLPTAGALVPYLGSVNTEASASELNAWLHDRYAHLDLVVASLGGWQQGHPLYSYPFDQWTRVLNDNLTSHFLAIKTTVPLLHPQRGVYVHINGFSAEEAYPLAAPVAMTAAAQKSLILSLAEEVRRTGIRVYEFILGPIKTRDRLKHGHGQDDWYFPEEIGHYLAAEVRKEHQDQVVHYLLKKELSD